MHGRAFSTLINAATSLDRFAFGLRDAQDVAAVDCCDGCGDEIYPGDAYQDSDTGKIYCERECAPVDAELMEIKINENGEVGM
jgi:hypothetical protein